MRRSHGFLIESICLATNFLNLGTKSKVRRSKMFAFRAAATRRCSAAIRIRPELGATREIASDFAMAAGRLSAIRFERYREGDSICDTGSITHGNSSGSIKSGKYAPGLCLGGIEDEAYRRWPSSPGGRTWRRSRR